MNYHFDYETFATADLAETGAYRYAESTSTEILLLAVASDTAGPFLWVNPKWRSALASDPRADELIALARQDPDLLAWAHNCQFERAVTMYVDGPLNFMRDRPHQWRCTQALCRKAAIPPSLEKATEYLGLASQKDSNGKKLIKLFSMPQKDGSRVFPTDKPEKFHQFGEYCLQDVRAEQELHRKLAAFELKGTTLDTFLLDITLNDRGVPVNLPALRNAKKIIDQLTGELHFKFQALTGLAPTQKAAVQAWLEKNGIELENMQGTTIAAALKTAPAGTARTALELYSELNYSAVKKVDAMLDSANADGRVRGTLLYHGASTGRWSGRGMQPQNFKKPTIKNTDLAYKMLCEGADADSLDLLFGNPLEVISSCIRNFIDDGKPILDADYAGIEARIVCWLAGQEDALQRFRDGADSYKVLAAMVYNRTVAEIPNPSYERDLGKEGVLGGGFGMGWGKFLKRCHTKGLKFVTPELAKRTINGFRAMHPEVVKLWYACDNAARRAIMQSGTRFNVGDKLSFVVNSVAGKPFLFMRLPSGRSLAYPEPKIEILTPPEGSEPTPFDDQPQITFYGQPPDSVVWCRVKTFGACLVENACQGIAACLMSNGMYQAEKAKYLIFALIHDQGLAHKTPSQTAPEFVRLLTDLPHWAKGLPLAAECKIQNYYKK
jgi:DNA polymerase